MKILIIEDERQLAEILKQGLEENAFTVDLSFDGRDGLNKVEANPYDAVLLDIMLPGMDGFAILSRLKSMRSEVPVILISAQGQVDSRIKGLNIGADDYIVKPFDFLELLARLRSVIRRSKGRRSPLVIIGDLVIDMNLRTVTRGGKKINLSPREYDLLEYMALNCGRVVTRSEIRDRIYSTETDPCSNVIDVYINFLRSKIDKGFDRQIIETVRGAGYLLRDNV